jgi:hypothetical protein
MWNAKLDGRGAFKITIDWKKIVMLKCNFNIIFACEDDMCHHPFIIDSNQHWSRKINVGLKPTIEWSWWHQRDWLHPIVELHPTNEFMTIHWYLYNKWN